MFNQSRLENHYRNILEQNREAILRGGVGDDYLKFPGRDTRMALALVIRISPNVCSLIEAYLHKLKTIEPDLYYYPARDLHITVLDLLRGVPDRTIPDNIDDYTRCIRECAKKISPFEIVFDGLTMSDNAVMIKGYYESALEDFRQELRRSMKRYGLLLEERYETFSAHITAARIPDQLRHPESFVTYLADKHPFGEMKVTAFELVFHNWYDSQKKVLAKILL